MLKVKSIPNYTVKVFHILQDNPTYISRNSDKVSIESLSRVYFIEFCIRHHTHENGKNNVKNGWGRVIFYTYFVDV